MSARTLRELAPVLTLELFPEERAALPDTVSIIA